MPCKIVSIQGLYNVISAFFIWRNIFGAHMDGWMDYTFLVMQNCTYTLLLALKSHLRDIYMKCSFAARGNVLKLIGQYLIPLCHNCISGIVKRRQWNLKFVPEHDGDGGMATSHGCFWSSWRVSDIQLSSKLIVAHLGTSLVTLFD